MSRLSASKPKLTRMTSPLRNGYRRIEWDKSKRWVFGLDRLDISSPGWGEPLTVLEKAVLGGIEQKKKNLVLFPEVSKNVL